MADDEDTFDAKEVMQQVVRTNTVPPPTRNPSRREALNMLASVVAATMPANSRLRHEPGIVVGVEGTDVSAKPIWKAISQKTTKQGASGALHKTLLKPATLAGRKAAQAAKGTKCFMFRRNKNPPMIHKDTVFMQTASGLLCVAYTISYVNGQVGCSKNYHTHNEGRKCKGWKCFVDLHHAATRRNFSGLCLVPNKINKLISQTVSPSPTKGIPRATVEVSYTAFAPDKILDNIFQLKRHEDRVRARDVDCVEIHRGTSKDHPSSLLLQSFMPDQPNFLYLESADSDHRRLAGVRSRVKGIYQFVDEDRPYLIDSSCVIQVYEYVSPEKRRLTKIRVLHCRCPILGIGGTKVGGGSSGEEAKNTQWPVVLHHVGKNDLRLVLFCHSEVNQAIDFIP